MRKVCNNKHPTEYRRKLYIKDKRNSTVVSLFLQIFNSIYFSAKCTRFVKNKNEIRLSASRAPREGKLLSRLAFVLAREVYAKCTGYLSIMHEETGYCINERIVRASAN